MEVKEPYMETIKFRINNNLVFGPNETKHINEHIKQLGFKKPGMVIDLSVANTDYGNLILNMLKKENINWLLYDFEEPTYELLDEYRNYFDCDCFVGIGGGSVIDFVKGLAFLATNEKSAISYRGFPTNINPPLPVIAIPTTAGTGSEATYNAVFIDKKTKTKKGINTTLNYPVLTILDPKLTLECPLSVTTSTGMDTLVHATEAYSCKSSNRIQKLIAKESIRLMSKYLLLVKDNPRDIDIRAGLQLGAWYGGIVVGNSGGGPTGALSYILGSKFNVPHGIAGAIFLPHIIKYNESKGFKYHVELTNTIFHLCDILYIPDKLSFFGVNENNVDVLLKELESFKPAFEQNPVSFTVKDAEKLIRSLI